MASSRSLPIPSPSPQLAARSMSSPLPRHAKPPTPLRATASSVCVLRPRGRLLLVRGSSGAAATPLVAAAASPDLACYQSLYYSVPASPSPRAASSTSSRRPAGGLVVLTVAASAVWLLASVSPQAPNPVAISACLIFVSAIRSMLACKREAEFLEKYFASAREKLPETMASVRLVAREISDLAADLSDLSTISQDLTKGVKSSMSIVNTAEAQLHQLKPSAPPGTAQSISNRKKVVEPLLASTVRDLRELISDIRSGFGAAIGMASIFMWASKFGSKRR
ncbi:hypothetical protein ACP70R_041565 [Stipagrostis hirtigluma subsp. patula]